MARMQKQKMAESDISDVLRFISGYFAMLDFCFYAVGVAWIAGKCLFPVADGFINLAAAEVNVSGVVEKFRRSGGCGAVIGGSFCRDFLDHFFR
jgi:hypothetical protein